MGSKRGRRGKQELEELPEKINVKKKRENGEVQNKPEISDSENHRIENIEVVVNKQSKKRKKPEPTENGAKRAKKQKTEQPGEQQPNRVAPQRRVTKRSVKKVVVNNVKPTEDLAEISEQPKESQEKSSASIEQPIDNIEQIIEDREHPKENSDQPTDNRDQPEDSNEQLKHIIDKPKENTDQPKDICDLPKDTSDQPRDVIDQPEENVSENVKAGMNTELSATSVTDQPKDTSDQPEENSESDSGNVKAETKIELFATPETVDPNLDLNILSSLDRQKEEITWPEEDLTELISRMETHLPEQDFMAYNTRAEKLDWNQIAFRDYSGDDCKKNWLLVQKRLRRFRLLREVLIDAKEWVKSPKLPPRTAGRPRRHPDMPRRPVSAYLLFYMTKKDRIIQENPGLDQHEVSKLIGHTFKNLPLEEKEKYDKLAAANKEIYEGKMKEFLENHPEFEHPVKVPRSERKDKESKFPKEPKLPKEFKVPKEPKVPKKPRAPKESKTPKELKIPRKPRIPKEPRAPKEPGAPMEPGVSKESRVPEEPKVANEPEAANESAAPSEPGSSIEPKTKNEPETPNEPKVFKEPNVSKILEIPNESEIPNKHKAPKAPKAPKDPTTIPRVPGTPKVNGEKLPKARQSKKDPNAPRKNRKEKPPKRNQAAFLLFFDSEIKNAGDTDKSTFKDKLREQWKTMSDNDKVPWIRLAEEDRTRYQEELKKYKEEHPEFEMQSVKATLTREDRALRERCSGKPLRPPNSAYGLYSKVTLKGEEIKAVHPRDRMAWMSDKWKSLPEEERNNYQKECDKQTEKYKEEMDAYCKTLPESEREKFLAAMAPPKKSTSKRKSKSRKRISKKGSKPKQEKIKFKEPEQPPMSACKYFATLYKGDADPAQAWKALSVEEKRNYEEQLREKKKAYIAQFEKFLKSLSKEELEAFSKSRQQTRTDNGEESDVSSDCTSESEEENEGEDDENDEDQGSESE